jgi:hypothetical protein
MLEEMQRERAQWQAQQRVSRYKYWPGVSVIIFLGLVVVTSIALHLF